MANIYLYVVPKWFTGLDVVFELAFALITLLVAIYAFKVYKLSRERQLQMFGFAFLFISISYFSWALLNLAILAELKQGILSLIELKTLAAIHVFAIYLHIVFFITGIATLAYVTLKIDSLRAYALLLAVSVVSVVFSASNVQAFFLMATILMLFVFINYFINYMNNRNPKSFLVMVAMFLLLIATAHFNFAMAHPLFYFIGHLLEFVSYVLVLVNLLMVMKK